MGQLLPVIKNFAWFQDDALILKEQLLDFDQSPVMGIGEDLETIIKYAEASTAEAYQEELLIRKKEALQNLRNLEVSYDVQDVNGCKVIVASGQEFASEKILDQDFLQKMHEELGSSQIAIGIPFQGLLIAISNNDTDLINKFPLVIKKHYENPQADKISDKVFLSIDSIIVAHAGIDGDIPVQAATDEPCFVQTMTLTGASDQDLEFVTFIGHQDLKVLSTTIAETYSKLLEKCKEENAISCVMKFILIPDIVNKSDELISLCKEFSLGFCAANIINTNAPTLNLFKLIFTYDQEDVLAENEYTKA